MVESELKEIMKKELKQEWQLNIRPYWSPAGWEGETLEESRTIVLFVNKDNYFGPFLHELAHAIQIEKRPNMKFEEIHDQYYADTLTILMIKYMKKIK